MNEKPYPVHESLLIGTLLTAAAGSFDAFTYLLHGEVFAGLQTGNVILLGIHLGQAQWTTAVRYMVPIFAFMFGTMAARALQLQAGKKSRPLTEQRWLIQYEITLILIVTLFGHWLPDLAASALVSLIAAAQLQEFRRLKGGPFTSLMMTGNLRTAAQSLYDGFIRGQQKRPQRRGHNWDDYFIICYRCCRDRYFNDPDRNLCFSRRRFVPRLD